MSSTNVILSSLLGPAGSTPKRLLATIQTAHVPVMSLALAAELGAVIVRPKSSRLGTQKRSCHQHPSFLIGPHIMAIVPAFTIMHPDLPDMADNRLLEVAIAADADISITSDKQLLALNTIRRPHAIEPEHLDG